MTDSFSISRCATCGHEIIWAVTTNARNMPVDAEPPLQGGNVALEWRGPTVHPVARVLGVTAQFGRADLRTSHHQTCPDGATWRRRARGRGGKADR